MDGEDVKCKFDGDMVGKIRIDENMTLNNYYFIFFQI